MEKYSRSKSSGLYLSVALTIASAGCASTAPPAGLEQRVACEDPQQSQKPFDPFSVDMVPDVQAQPRQAPRADAREVPQDGAPRVAGTVMLYGGHGFGVEYLHEGPKDAQGSDRTALDRVGVGLANIGLDQINGLPLVGLVVQDGPRSRMPMYRDLFGRNPDGSAKGFPGLYAPTTTIVGGVRAITTYPLRHAAERFVDWATRCGECNGCQKAEERYNAQE